MFGKLTLFLVVFKRYDLPIYGRLLWCLSPLQILEIREFVSITDYSPARSELYETTEKWPGHSVLGWAEGRRWPKVHGIRTSHLSPSGPQMCQNRNTISQFPNGNIYEKRRIIRCFGPSSILFPEIQNPQTQCSNSMINLHWNCITLSNHLSSKNRTKLKKPYGMKVKLFPHCFVVMSIDSWSLEGPGQDDPLKCIGGRGNFKWYIVTCCSSDMWTKRAECVINSIKLAKTF